MFPVTFSYPARHPHAGIQCSLLWVGPLVFLCAPIDGSALAYSPERNSSSEASLSNYGGQPGYLGWAKQQNRTSTSCDNPETQASFKSLNHCKSEYAQKNRTLLLFSNLEVFIMYTDAHVHIHIHTHAHIYINQKYNKNQIKKIS